MAVSISGHRDAHLGCMNTAKLCLVTSADAGTAPPFTQCIVARSRPPECICMAWTPLSSPLLQDTIPGWQCLGISRQRAGTAFDGCLPDVIRRQREDSLQQAMRWACWVPFCLTEYQGPPNGMKVHCMLGSNSISVERACGGLLVGCMPAWPPPSGRRFGLQAL